MCLCLNLMGFTCEEEDTGEERERERERERSLLTIHRCLKVGASVV